MCWKVFSGILGNIFHGICHMRPEKRNSMLSLTRASLANRPLLIIITIALIFTGVYAAANIRQDLFPPTEAPMAQIQVSFPGASPNVVESEISVPLESAAQNVEEVRNTSSVSSNSHAVINAWFLEGRGGNEGVEALDEAVRDIGLPSGARMEIVPGGDGDAPAVTLAATADVDDIVLTRNLEQHVVPGLEAIPGVRTAAVFGHRPEIVQIVLDNEKMSEYGLAPQDISQSLDLNGVVLPGGELDNSQHSLSVDVGREFDTLDELGDLRLAVAPSAENPDPVRLSEVAEIRETVNPPRSISRVDGRESVSVMVYPTPDANPVEVSSAIRRAIPGLADDLGESGELLITLDTAPYIQDSIRGLAESGVFGLAIAVAIILLFLLSARATIVTAVSIPLSLLIAIAGLWAGGQTLNILTLAALAMAVGRLVDDSIVVVENIKRHLGYGTPRHEAVLTGVREVATSVCSSTLITIAAFVPVAFLGGTVGALFRPFAITMMIALLASLIVALTIVPVLAYWFITGRTAPEGEADRVRAETEAAERRQWWQRGYIALLTWITRRSARGWRTWRRWSVVGIGLVVLAFTVLLSEGLRFTLLEDDGQNNIVVQQELPVGTSLSVTNESVKRAEAVLDSIPDISSYEAVIGGDGAREEPHKASYWISASAEADMQELRSDVLERLERVDGIGELRMEDLSGNSVGGGSSTSSVEVVLRSNDTEALREAVDTVSDMMSSIGGTSDVTSDLTVSEPGIKVTPRPEKAAEHALSDHQLAEAVDRLFRGPTDQTVLIGEFERNTAIVTGEDVPVSLEELREAEISTPVGNVKLSEVAVIEEEDRPAEIIRNGGERSVTVQAEVDSSALGEVAAEINRTLPGLDTPAGVSAEVAGQAEELGQAQEDLLFACLVSLVICFLLMVAQFRSIAQALVLLAAVPFTFTGVTVALLLTGTPMSVSGGIGFLMLIGIVVTNTIVLIDLVNQYRRRGLTVPEAVVEGGRLRARPIIMTAISTIGALTPIALGLGSNGMLIAQSLAIVTIGGLVSSTLLSLAVVPALYTVVEETKERWSARLSARTNAGTRTEVENSSTKPRPDRGPDQKRPAEQAREMVKTPSHDTAAPDEGEG
ncbi:efflux RND transporter permease subunit [Nocardiopsis terrae]